MKEHEKEQLGADAAAVDFAGSIEPSQLSHDEPFRVEVDKGGCERCGHGTQWTVVGPDDCYINQSFENKELVEEIADYMNQGFSAGSLASKEHLLSALAAFRARRQEPTLTSYSAHAVNGLIEAIEKALEP